MVNNQRFVLAAILALGVAASATVVNECKSGVARPVQVDVVNCEVGPCELPKGTKIYMNVTFDAPNDLEAFEPQIVAHAMGIDVDYPLAEKDGCKGLFDGECPLEEGERVLYGTAIEILSLYPNIDFGIEMTLYTYNEDGDRFPFTCFQIDGKVVG